jgi:predicted aldo/keto reductase-like oxidoreductase
MTDGKPVDRRKVLLYTLAGVGATTAATIGGGEWLARKRQREARAALAALGADTFVDTPGLVRAGDRVERRRRLGRTNLDVSIVSIGAGGLNELEPIARAVDKGMNYVDTSTCYSGSEDTLGRAFVTYPGLRDKLVIATKWDPGATSSKDEMLASLDQSLKRMRTDHVEIMQVHWLGGGHKSPDNGFNRLDNDEVYRAMEIAKKAGKVRFFGATSHDGNRSKILQHAIDKGFDMILVKMNVLDHETADLPALLAKAKERDVGVVAMKSQPGGGRLPKGFEKSKYNVFQANLRWVLSHPEVASVVHSSIGTTPHMQDLAASAVQEELSLRDEALLEQYAAALSPEYCRECAGGCTDACPTGVAIPHVMHLVMYERDYGWKKYARELYGEMPAGTHPTDACLSCRRCTDACPYGVDAASAMREAPLRLG